MSSSQHHSDVTVRECSDSDDAAWDNFVEARAEATVYHLSAWRHLIKRVFGKNGHYLIAQRGDAWTGILPLVRLKSLLFGDFLVSMPYLSYGGIVADDSATRDALLAHCAALGQQLGVRHAELRHTEDLSSWPKRTEKVSMHLPLLGDSDARWKALGAKRRSQIKRPLREGVEAEEGGVELVADFYRVLSLKYRDLGTPIYPLSWFRGILEQFPEKAMIFLVRMQGEPVASSLVIRNEGRVEVPYAASLRAADRFGVNMFLYWTMLKYAEDNAYDFFDFGRSTVDSGTWRFKKQWGAEEVPLYWHYWLADGGEPPQLNTSNPKYEMLINAWRRLPVWATTIIGPRIVRNLP